MGAELNPTRQLHALGQSLWLPRPPGGRGRHRRPGPGVRPGSGGPGALEGTIAAGIRVNVTLLFSDPHYLRTALAERLQREGAGRFSADWAALLSAITEKAGMSPGPSGA